MNKYEEKTITTEQIYEGKIISLRVEKVQLPNGENGTRELVKHPGAVAIIAITDEKKLVVVEQYRKALNRSIIEIPAGKIEPNEEPKKTAIRELEEETGYGAKRFSYLQSFATSPGFADEVIHLYLAQDLFKITDPAKGDDDEFLNLLEITIEQAETMMNLKEIFDAKTAYAVLFAKNFLKG